MTVKSVQLPEHYRHLFGSSGIRGIVGQALTEEFCYQIAQAIGSLLPQHSRVCIATDTRTSREVVSDSVVAGLRTTGVDVTRLGILPTPALAYTTGNMGFDTGIMVTASHNPPRFNGIKLFNRDCIGYSRTQERAIEKVYHQRTFRYGMRGSLTSSPEAKEKYFSFIQNRFSNGGTNHSLKIMVDAGNGAATRLPPNHEEAGRCQPVQ